MHQLFEYDAVDTILNGLNEDERLRSALIMYNVLIRQCNKVYKSTKISRHNYMQSTTNR